jgi:hypothetical protein
LKVIHSGYGELLPHYGIHFIHLKCIGWGFCVLMTCKYETVIFLEKLKTNDVHYGFLNRWSFICVSKRCIYKSILGRGHLMFCAHFFSSGWKNGMCVVASTMWKLMSFEVLWITCAQSLGFILTHNVNVHVGKFVNLPMKNPLNVLAHPDRIPYFNTSLRVNGLSSWWVFKVA